jgi:hypothetical protein
MSKPALVGVPPKGEIQSLEGKIRLLDGGHRTQAARKAGIDLPVLVKSREALEAAYGTPSWEDFTHNTVPAQDLMQGSEKIASIEDEWLKLAFLGKKAKLKRSEIIKDVVPDYYKGKAVELATSNEKDIPKDLLDSMARSSPLENILSTSGGLGMVLKPREFQRIILVQIGHKDLADDLDKKNITFPKTDEKTDVPMGPQFFSKLLSGLLRPFFEGRSALAPALESRIIMSSDKGENKKTKTSSQETDLLHKIGSSYNGYRSSLMDLVAHVQPLISAAIDPSDDLYKVASAPVDDVFTTLSVAYLQDAFWNEVPVSGDGVKTA